MLSKIEDKMYDLIFEIAKSTNEDMYILKNKNIDYIYYIYLKRNEFYEEENKKVELIYDYDVTRKDFKEFFDFNIDYMSELIVTYDIYFENKFYSPKGSKRYKFEYSLYDYEYNLEKVIDSIKAIKMPNIPNQISQVRIINSFVFEPIRGMYINDNEELIKFEISIHSSFEVGSLF